MAKLILPDTADFSGWDRLLGDRHGLKIGPNTYAERASHGRIAIRLHYTQIVVFQDDGTIILNSGGFRTVTTKNRMNAVLPRPIGVVQRQRRWYIVDSGVAIDFFDGMTIQVQEVK